MSIYGGTDAGELERCFASVVSQTLQPGEIVIVFDGPVKRAVGVCVAELAASRCVRMVEFPDNRGLGAALRDGLSHCTSDIVARMDTDDVCMPGRFETQYRYLAEHPEISLVGGLLRERKPGAMGNGIVVRKLPESPDEIRHFAKYRNPLNHPTVMFRKLDVLKAGSFIHFPLLEDYYLWVRMLVHGYRIANVPQVLVEAQADIDYFARRGGIAYLCQEIRLARRFRDLGFHRWWDTIWFVVSRAPIRLMPGRARRWMYGKMLRVRHYEEVERESLADIERTGQ